jgi:hypothetical protein
VCSDREMKNGQLNGSRCSFFFFRKSMFLRDVDSSKSAILAGGIVYCAIARVQRLESGRDSWECLIFGSEWVI